MKKSYKLNSKHSFTKILIVDDVFYVKRTLSRMLTDEGYFVLTATGGVEALEKVIKYSPDLIAIGQKISDMTIIELVKMIKQNKYRDKLLFISSREDTDFIDSKTTSKFDLILSSPITKKDLITYVKQLTKKNCYK